MAASRLVSQTDWDEIFSDRQWGRWPSEDLVRFVAHTFGDGKGLRVLELGCGPGANLWYLAKESFEVHAIDYSRVAVERAAKRMVEEGFSLAGIRCASFDIIPWPSNHFDLLVDIEAISESTPDVVGSVIPQSHRVLKPGGWFFGKMFADDSEYVGSHNTGHRFGESELRELFKEFCSFHLDRTTRSDRGRLISEWLVQAQKAPLLAKA